MRYIALLRRLGSIAIPVLALTGSAWAGLPDNGLPDNGIPDNGLPDNGLPDNGLPDNGNSPDALINSPLFFDSATHSYWVGNPFTAGSFRAPGNPLAVALSDPFSALVISYQWQLCHPAGDDATVLDSHGAAHTFHGRIGLCVLADGHGWHADQPLDYETARWLSAATITQVNRFQVHNRYSARGPTPKGGQLTAMAGSMTSYIYHFGTDTPVEALQPCSQPGSGLDPCGWKPHFVGLGKPGSTVSIGASSNGVRMILQVNLGIHAANPGDPAAIAHSGSALDPEVTFVVPEGGTFNVQWAPDPRPTSSTLPASIAAPKLDARVISGGGTLRFPADEVFVFTHREMYATAMLFNLSPADANIAPIPGVDVQGLPVAECAPRINSDGRLQFCDASRRDGCVACRRTASGGLNVFPNAHMWLSSSWNSADDYYRLRSCSSDLSTCVATFEGFIDTRYCGPSDPHCLARGSKTVSAACRVQSQDRDTATPRPYRGSGKRLLDASQCHIGSGPDTGYGVTTFFANYGTQGACWATAPNDPACRYTRRVDSEESEDDGNGED